MPVNDSGLVGLIARIMGSGGAFNYGHWGTGTTAWAASQTGLITPASEARVIAATSTQVTGPAPAITNDSLSQTFRLINANAAGGAVKNITEFAIFNALTGGTMLMREVFAAYAIAGQEGMEFAVILQLERGD